MTKGGTSGTRPGNTKGRARRYCFTLNNYTTDEYGTLVQHFDAKGWSYIIGKEVGENKTPHLQGYLESKSPIRFCTLKTLNERIHWEKAKGSREHNINYCSKDGDFTSTFPLPLKLQILDKIYSNITWKDWQQEIISLVSGDPDSRSIYWFVDTKGNTGKSFLAKYICLKYKVVIADGKKADVFNQIKHFMDEVDPMGPRIIILDLPRSALGYVNYGMIEQIKNGLIYSGKYEGGQCIFFPPHVIIFANEEPDYNQWSDDRYVVRHVE